MKYRTLAIAVLLSLGIWVAPVSTANAKTAWIQPDGADPLPTEVQQQIRSWVNEGAAASARNDSEGARAALLKAWDMKPLAMIAANLGYVEIKLGLYREAAEHLQFFLDKAPTDHPEQRSDAEQRLAECRKHITIVEIQANVYGAQVTMDGLEIGLTPLANKRFVEPGMRTIEVTSPGYQPQTRAVSFEAGGDVVVRFELRVEPVLSIDDALPNEPAPVVRAVSAPLVAVERTGVQPRTWFLIGGSAATAMGLGVGIAYRIKANSLNRDANSTLAQVDDLSTSSQIAKHEECFNRTGTALTLCNQFHSTLTKEDSAINISTPAFITAGALGVATVATHFLWPRKTSKIEQKHQAWIQVSPWSTSAVAGVRVTGGF